MGLLLVYKFCREPFAVDGFFQTVSNTSRQGGLLPTSKVIEAIRLSLESPRQLPSPQNSLLNIIFRRLVGNVRFLFTEK